MPGEEAGYILTGCEKRAGRELYLSIFCLLNRAGGRLYFFIFFLILFIHLIELAASSIPPRSLERKFALLAARDFVFAFISGRLMFVRRRTIFSS